jgi:hypothetical protein
MTTSNRLLIIMGSVLVALLIVAAIVIAVREPATFDPGSPEAATQAYVVAVLDDDPEAAHALLIPELQERCTVLDLGSRYVSDGGRITLADSRIVGDAAVVELEFSATYSDGPFDISQSIYTERFELKLVDGNWLISEIPWPFYWCAAPETP